VPEIDGSDGGGQIVRTAVSLAAVTGEAVRIDGVRADRPDPGLKPQHLAAIEAVASACDATVEGAEVGADAVEVHPGTVRGGDLAVAVGTAGSVTLVADALLPLATVLPDDLCVRIDGGTDVKWSPPVAYHRRVKLPLLADVGLDATLEVDRRGFYPAGGGQVTLRLAPSSLDRLDLTARGRPVEATVTAVASEDLAAAEVAERLATTVADGVDATLGATVPVATDAASVSTTSTGAGVTLAVTYDATRAGFDALGEPGVPAETVGETVLEAWRTWRDGPGVVDRHLADQLVVPLALAGGRVRAPEPTPHLRTNCRTASAFDGTHDVRLEPTGGSADGVLLVAD
jgi:RNA 3'-terminal phosphate cyclase (ATP)